MSNDEKVLAEMQAQERGWWPGLEELAEATQLEMKEVALSIKSLKKQGLIYSDAIFDEATGLLNGRGWFVKQNTK